MNIELTRGPDEWRDQFKALQCPQDIAEMLEVSHRDLNYWIYRTPEKDRYTSFHIAKKSGASRQIDAPNPSIKILQRKLNTVLQTVYWVKPSAHGFASGKSVKTNAEQHIQKRWVFNVDLDNFFHSIHFGRVRGMFMGKPYNLPPDVSTVLAHMCCYQKRLPQGAPTSPVISNMICAQMDSQLQQLAKSNRATYTRYADDITFSVTSRRFPPALAYINVLKQVHVGGNLRKIIEDNGFAINESKIWLRGRHQRQEVTGVTVNDRTNLPRRFTNQIRAMLHAWEIYGLEAAQEVWEMKNAHKHRAPWSQSIQFDQVVKGKIEYLGMVKGKNSMTYLKFIDKIGELDRKLDSGRGTPLRLLLHKYDDWNSDSSNPQRRGYNLEDILSDLFEIFDIPTTGRFLRNAGGEQIDGGFVLDQSPCLVECKWTSKAIGQRDIDAFYGKVARSSTQTMGLFVSINGVSSHVVNLTKQNQEKRIFLMGGNDLRAVLAGKISLIDLLQAKLNALRFRSEPFLGVDEIIT